MTLDRMFEQLYEREFPVVFRVVLAFSGDHQVAEDATQEAFARALVRWRRLRSHPAPGGWVTTTALNAARRQLRKHPTIPATKGPTAPNIEERLMLVAAVRALPARQQEAIALHYLMDMSVAETAVVMDIDIGTVKTHLARARSSLSRVLQEEPEPGTRRNGHA